MPADTKENGTAFHEPFPLSGPGSGLGQLSDPDRRNSMDDLPTAYELADPVSGGGYMGLTVSAGRLRLFFLVLAAGLLIMAARLAQVQLVQGEQYQKRAEGNRTRVVWSPSQRGILYDRNGKTLVSNVPHFSATLRTADLITGSDKEPLISRLAGILDMTAGSRRKSRRSRAVPSSFMSSPSWTGTRRSARNRGTATWTLTWTPGTS